MRSVTGSRWAALVLVLAAGGSLVFSQPLVGWGWASGYGELTYTPWTAT